MSLGSKTITNYYFLCFSYSSTVTPSVADASSSPDGSPYSIIDDGPITTSLGGNNQLPGLKYVTKTVAGFLDFVTTVGNTVMIFTPRVNNGELLIPLISTHTVFQFWLN